MKRSRTSKPVRQHPRKHLFVPDIQARPGVPLDHVHWLACYALDKGPDVVVLAGDLYDMPSLSSYDARGSASAEGRRVAADLAAGDRVLEILANEWARAGFAPELHVTLGNHEARLDRAIDASPHLLEGTVRGFAFEQHGWTVHPFLQPTEIDGVRYCHFFPHGANGRVTQTKRGAPSANVQLRRQMRSCTAGHQQGLDTCVASTPTGLARGLIAGSYYLHDEAYMGPLNQYWRGLVLKHDVHDGDYALCEVPIKYLERKYGRVCPRETA